MFCKFCGTKDTESDTCAICKVTPKGCILCKHPEALATHVKGKMLIRCKKLGIEMPERLDNCESWEIGKLVRSRAVARLFAGRAAILGEKDQQGEPNADTNETRRTTV